MMLTNEKVAELEKQAEPIRETIIQMLVAAGSGHTAGPLGMADIFTAFYFHILAHDAKNPDWEERDRLILSNGHICPVQYATMAHAGYFPFRSVSHSGSLAVGFKGHPERLRLPGLETTSGPLGEGLSQAAGIAYAFRMDGGGKMSDVPRPTVHVGRGTSYMGVGGKRRVYCVMSDGEQEEGNIWEAALFAGKKQTFKSDGDYGPQQHPDRRHDRRRDAA